MSLNILTNKLPDKVVINGTEVKINTDFRICLKCILAFEDKNLTMQEKVYILLKNMYGEVPDDELIEEYTKQAIFFLNMFEEDTTDENPKRVYSFEKDAKFIYVAFKQSLDVDLNKTSELHWWDFVTYFMALDEKSFFSRMISLRMKKNEGKLTKEELRYWTENKELLELEKVEVEEDEETKRFKDLFKQG